MSEPDDDTPELTDADLARAQPFATLFPDAYQSLRRRGGRPRLARPKLHIGFRLDADVVEGIRATGKGYNARVEKVLREALAQGKF